MIEKTIEELLELLEKKEITSEELVKESVAKAKEYQDKYNSFVTIIDNPTSSVNDLSASLFKGIPCAIKDNISHIVYPFSCFLHGVTLFFDKFLYLGLRYKLGFPAWFRS